MLCSFSPPNRQGSQFQIRYGVRTGDLGSPDVMGDSNNGSLLFRTSNRTAFLLGGWPTGAQVSITIVQRAYSKCRHVFQ